LVLVSTKTSMTLIKQEDLIQSVADALQFISYYHPLDFIRALRGAYEREESPAANTGIVIVYVDVGMDIQWDAELSVDDMINEGVRRGYNFSDNVLRASVLRDPDGLRANTKDNTPAVVHYRMVPGDKLGIEVAAKGGGSEAKANWHWRHAREGDDAGQRIADGAHRYSRSNCARRAVAGRRNAS